VQKGKFYGVGVGPGDPRHLTLRAVEVLKRVDVVAYPKSRRDRESLALNIVRDYLSPEVELLELEMPMTDDEEALRSAWEAGAQAIVEALDRGRSVAFVTLGDCSLYSTYSYLLQYLKPRIPEERIETVPGVTSLSAAAARLNIPLALGDEPLVVLPSSEEAEYYLDFPNVVVLKVSRRLPQILDILEYKGKEAVLATRIGQSQEEVHLRPRAQDFKDRKVDYMSLLVVKEDMKKWAR